MDGIMEVICAGCGRKLDEDPSADPADRQPCPDCGSRSRNFNVNLIERLNTIERTYAQAQAGSNTRIADLIDRAERIPKLEPPKSFTADALIESEVGLVARLLREQGEATRTALTALIDTIRLGQEDTAKRDTKLNDLTGELVTWTRVIGVATLLALAFAAFAVLRSPSP